MQLTRQLDEYISLDPETEQKSSFQYLMSLLKKLVKNENLCNELKTLITTLKQKNKTLTEKYEKLVIENQNIKEIIEKLKQLDIQLEKKRENR